MGGPAIPARAIDFGKLAETVKALARAGVDRLAGQRVPDNPGPSIRPLDAYERYAQPVVDPVVNGLRRVAEFIVGKTAAEQNMTALMGTQTPMGMAVIRPKGWEAANDVPTSWTRPGHAYRGMTEDEYLATVGAGRGVRSRQDFSLQGEGTSFAPDAADAESYANFGRTDPRMTGKPTYLIEVEGGPDLRLDRDGYLKALNAIPQDRIRRVWLMSNKGGAVDAVLINPQTGRVLEQ